MIIFPRAVTWSAIIVMIECVMFTSAPAQGQPKISFSLTAAQWGMARIPIPAPCQPGAVAVNPRTKKIYVGSATGSSVTIIDGNTAANTATFVPTGSNPMSFAVDATNNQVYVLNRGPRPWGEQSASDLSGSTLTTRDGTTNNGGSTLSRIDGTTNLVTQMTPLLFRDGGPLLNGLALVAWRNKTYLYCASPFEDAVYIYAVDSAPREFTKRSRLPIPKGIYANSLSANPNAGKVYLLCEHAILVFEGATVAATIPTVGVPDKVSINPISNKSYVTIKSPAELLEIDGLSNAATTVTLDNVLQAGDIPSGLAVHASLRRVYFTVSNRDVDSKLIIVDRATQTATASILENVRGVRELAIDESENRLFATTAVLNQVFVINPVAHSGVRLDVGRGQPSSVSAGGFAQVVATLPGTHKAYVASTLYPSGAGEVAVIDAPGLPAVQVDRIEVSQAIQDVDQTIPLIAQKPTVVRVFLSGGPVSDVGGILEVGPVPDSPSPSFLAAPNIVTVAASPSSLRDRREDANQSFNFVLPPLLRSQGTYHVALARLTDAAGGSVPPCTNCETLRRQLNFEPPIEMRLHVIGLSYTGGQPMQTFEPRQIDYDMLQSWLTRAYPISRLTFSKTTMPMQSPAPDPSRQAPFKCEEANAQLSHLRELDVASGTDQRTRYYGMVLEDRRNGSFFMRGCSSSIPESPDPSIVASGPTGPTGVEARWDTDASWGDWYGAHEIGHTLGRFHAGPITTYRSDPGPPPERVPVGPCGEDWPDTSFPYPAGQIGPNDGTIIGTDLGDSAVNVAGGILPVPNWHDVMSYCDYQWIGKYTYLAFLNRLRAENAMPAHGAATTSPAPSPTARATAALKVSQSAPPLYVDGDFISIVGTANVTRQEARITFVSRVQRAKIRPTDPASPVRLRAYDRNDKITGDTPATFLPNSDSKSGEVRGVVEAVIPATPDLKAIELLIAGKVAARYEAPAKTNLAPVELRTAPAAQPPKTQATRAPVQSLRLEWGPVHTTAAVPSETPGVTYDVQASGDGGRTWQTLAVGLSSPNVQVDLSVFKDIREVDVRVIANGGFDSKVIAKRKVQR